MSKIDLLPNFIKEIGGQFDQVKLEELRSITHLPIKEGQLVIDSLFSAENRVKKLAEQEEDSCGAKVRYFRKMSLDAFIKMAKIGYQDAASYADENPPVIDQAELKHLIIGSFRLEKQEIIELRDYSLKDLISEYFGKEAYEKLEASEFGYSSVMDFVKNLDEEYIKQKHTGSVMQKISPFLSLSVGGVISTLSSEKYPYRRIYCEIVKHDIIAHKHGVNGEKEVFVKKLKMSDIIGAYVDDDAIFELITHDSTFSQGRFYKEHKDELRFRDDVIEQWRWDVSTNDCLPERLRDESAGI